MEGNPKQLIVDRIKNATNILVTVSRDPSVDELAAALGLTLMLNKMDKHATAVFSGEIPPAISFLEPGKTFESTVDSLRDFIIALDKEKADRLRYKVEDDVVRIYITPYRTTITQADLEFTQGDFNVELIIALGVDRKDDLDAAVVAHGRILHDATVVTINANNEKNSLGSIGWNEASASSLCEMLMSLSEALQSGLLDEQIATGLLTGIVAATDRFSNPRTSPKVMTMAAQLMAAGANQQLIAARLEEGHVIDGGRIQNDGSTKLAEGSSEKVQDAEQSVPATEKPLGDMHIEHSEPVVAAAPSPEPQPIFTQPAEPASNPFVSTPASNLSVSDLQRDIAAANSELEEAAALPGHDSFQGQTDGPQIEKSKGSDWRGGKVIEPPSLGGTLSATSSEAEEARIREEQSTRNHTILSHDGPDAGAHSIESPANTEEPAPVNVFDSPLSYEPAPSPSRPRVIEPLTPSISTDNQSVTVGPSIADLEAQVRASSQLAADGQNNSIDNARAAVDAALGNIGSTLVQPAPVEYPVSQPPQAIDTALPPPPPLPDFSSLPPLPPLPGEPQQPAAEPVANPQFPQQPPANNDPSQFRIPGQ